MRSLNIKAMFKIRNASRGVRYLQVFFFSVVIFISYSVFGQKAIPELWGLHVHDEAHILSQQTVDNLEKELVAYEDSTTNEIAVLIISSLEGNALESYSLKVVEKWQLGKKGKDNGVLLLIVVDEHKMRIETGYGLEGVLTDAICSRIIRNEIAPQFRQNNYDAGITGGIHAIFQAIGQEYTAEDSDPEIELGWKERVLVGVFIFGILGVFTMMALFIPGCGGWFLYAFLIPFYATFPMVVLGTSAGIVLLIAYIISLPILKLVLGKSNWGKQIGKKFTPVTNARGGGWSSGSGWSSGGGRSSGGFSGGGGSFGGGGSSGSW